MPADEIGRRLRAFGQHAERRQPIAGAPGPERVLSAGVGPPPNQQRTADEQCVKGIGFAEPAELEDWPMVASGRRGGRAPRRERNMRQ